MPRNWGEFVRSVLGWTGAGSVVFVGGAGQTLTSVPNGTDAVLAPPPDTGTLVFERQNHNDGQARFAGHSSHASHASHASHSSHYSGSGGGYYSAPPPPPPPPAPAYTPPLPDVTTQPLKLKKPGAVDKLVMVMRVQSKLHDLGYYTGTIDGKLGPKTVDALKRYQTVQGLAVTGKLDDETLAALGIVY